ncbi:MAG: galactokinase [Tepidiforma sp.]|nr:MAG: galactokinase [Tepidiforma sp.]
MNPLDAARAAFREHFGTEPALLVRTPGRVNLIGEHTDYNGLPVLPFAIDRITAIAAAPSPEPALEAVSLGFEPPARLPLDADPAAVPEPWHRYLAAVLAVLRPAAPLQGVRLAIASDIPPASGLSSSSALSVGMLITLDALLSLGLPHGTLAELAARAERLAGAETGGMDQRVIACARERTLLRIDFLPPAMRTIPVPPGWSFVVASSGLPAPKGGTAREAYNERVVGTRIAAALLADMLGAELEDVPILGNVAAIDAAPVLVDELPARISARRAAAAAGVPLERLVTLSAGTFDPETSIPVRAYARHVLAEAERVDLACAAVEAADLPALGELLLASHASLRDDYRCSTPALDALVTAMHRAGAAGARLTGAGFGGFAVAVCEMGRESRVIEAAVRAAGGPAFAVTPSAGAGLA